MQGFGVLYGLIHNETRCNDPNGTINGCRLLNRGTMG